MGEVAGRSLLHLQCHLGLDTLSWARLGAQVTGVDFSAAAITAACSLAKELHLDATFIRSDIATLPDVLTDQFDIVFASYGVLPWLPDIQRWARVAAHFLNPGGVFYLIDGHPLAHLLDDTGERPEPGARYFHDSTPFRVEKHGSYVGPPTPFAQPVTYQWQHSLGDIVSAIVDAGLQVEFLHEWPAAAYQAFEPMTRGDDGWWRLPGDAWPLLFSLKATLPSAHNTV